MNESCPICHWIKARQSWEEACHTYEYIMSHIWLSHSKTFQCVTSAHMNESQQHTCTSHVPQKTHPKARGGSARVMLHICIVHITYVIESCQHMWMGHVAHMTMSYHTYDGVMSTHVNESRLTENNFRMRQGTRCLCDVTHSHVNTHIWLRHATSTHMISSRQHI